MSCLTAGDYARLNDILSTDVGDIEVNYENHGWFLREFPEDYSYSKWLPAGILFSQKRGGGSTSIKNILGNKWRDWRNLILFDGKTINEHLGMKRAKTHIAVAVIPPPEAIVVPELKLCVWMDHESRQLVEVTITGSTDAPDVIRLYDAQAKSSSMTGVGRFYDDEIVKIEHKELTLESLLIEANQALVAVGEMVVISYSNGTAFVCEIVAWDLGFEFRGKRTFQKITVKNAKGEFLSGKFNTDYPENALLLNDGGTIIWGVKSMLVPFIAFSEGDKNTKDAKRVSWEGAVGKVEGFKSDLDVLAEACPKGGGDLAKVQGAVESLGDLDTWRVARFALPLISLERLKQLQNILGDIVTAKENLASAALELETMRGKLETKEETKEKPATPPPPGFATMEAAEEE